MALLEKHRSVIDAHLVEVVGEEAAEAMLAQFPSRDLDEPVTKEFVALQVAELRSELRSDVAAVRTEIADLRGELGRQTDRLMTRLHLVAGVGFAVLAFLTVLAR